MAKSVTKDMTVGSPMKLILSFSMPLLIGFIFQQFYSVVDTFIVGRTLGMNALAGVGATGSINFLIVGFVMGVCGGCVNISRDKRVFFVINSVVYFRIGLIQSRDSDCAAFWSKGLFGHAQVCGELCVARNCHVCGDYRSGMYSVS